MEPHQPSMFIFFVFIIIPILVIWAVNKNMAPKPRKRIADDQPVQYWSLPKPKPSRLRVSRFCANHSRVRDVNKWCVVVDTANCERCNKERR